MGAPPYEPNCRVRLVLFRRLRGDRLRRADLRRRADRALLAVVQARVRRVAELPAAAGDGAEVPRPAVLLRVARLGRIAVRVLGARTDRRTGLPDLAVVDLGTEARADRV